MFPIQSDVPIPVSFTNLRNALLVLSSEKDGPCDSAGVLSLEEQRLGLSILESEDFAVATDVELALQFQPIVSNQLSSERCWFRRVEGRQREIQAHLSGVDLLSAEGVFVGPHVGDCRVCR